MPRSSRHKSHKQHKHSCKDSREYSDSEEDGNLKDRKGKEEAAARVSRDSASGEKRKLASQSQEGKDLFGPGNGDLSEQYVSSKRRKDRADATVTDRWNGGQDKRGVSVVGDKETNGDGFRPESEKGPKSKVSVDSKSKSSRRDDSLTDRKDEKVSIAVEGEEVKKSINKVESRRKSEKDSGRKEVYQHTDVKEKEREPEKDRKVQDGRREKSVDTVVVSEVSRKQGSHSGSLEEDRQVKREVENTEWQIQDELRNPELEKELEKRIRRRRDNSGDRDKYQDDARDTNDKGLSSRDDNAKNGRYKEERHKDVKYRDKYREDPDRDRRHRDERHKDERSIRDHTNDRPDTRHLKGDSDRHKKSKPHDSDRDGSPHLDDRGSRYRDNRVKKRSYDENEDHIDVKSRSSKEHRSDMENKSSSSKVESNADRGRSQSRHVDIDSPLANNRRKSSPSSSTHVAKDQYRNSSKQADSKYRDSASEGKIRPNDATSTRDVSCGSAVQERTFEARSLDKKDDNHLGESFSERSPRSDYQVSPMLLMEKSPSSSNIDRRYSNRMGARRSLDVEDTGRRSTGSRDARDYSTNEERGSRELPLEKPTVDEYSQIEGDTVSVTSSFNRSSHLSSTSPSIRPPPPPIRAGVDSPAVLGSSEEDSRGKSINRFKRSGEPSVSRGQGNAWKGVTTWSSPVANGYISFPHGPPPGGFHPVMQQFPASPIFGVRPLELNHAGLPYHIPDADRFSGHGRPFGWRNPADDSFPPHMHGWDAGNGVFGDDPHMYGRPDWDQNRHLMNGGADMWKGQNGSMNAELSSASQKEVHHPHAPAEEIWAGQPGQRSRNERNRPGPRAESIEIKRTSSTPPPKDISEAPLKTMDEKTPKPCKISSDEGTHFCHVYLAKLDISADLTLSDLYDQCMGLLDVEGKTTDSEDATKHVHPDLEVGAGVKISKASTCVSLFPAVNDSVFQRAMALYKKENEEMRAKVNASSPKSEPPKVMTSVREGVEEHFLLSNKEAVEGPIPVSNQEEPEGPFPTSKEGEEKDLFPACEQGKVEKPIRTSSEEKLDEMEDSVSDPGNGKREEPVPTHGEGKSDEKFPKSDQDKVEIVASIHQEESEEAAGDHSSSLENASQVTGKDDDMHDASSLKVDPCANSAEETWAFGDIMCGPVGFSDSSEACEALMPESIECGLVNLSRIHHSPESTH
ncbi:zinc finger CCCH domain-containing protein 13-like [Macadamia integrifolia]|uniref:zinc finger CCCH domain-containing protein 13-like n=1 Tax=Macadamia integrifolia TaxID=60698 RepID=UPI001C4E5DAB|nr:zinc finger CCCH domain-containing protein 13-like [Macadamia integrifolia]